MLPSYKKEGRFMALAGIIGGVILLCILAALWATGSATTRQFNFHGRNRGVDHQDPHPRSSGLN